MPQWQMRFALSSYRLWMFKGCPGLTCVCNIAWTSGTVHRRCRLGLWLNFSRKGTRGCAPTIRVSHSSRVQLDDINYCSGQTEGQKAKAVVMWSQVLNTLCHCSTTLLNSSCFWYWVVACPRNIVLLVLAILQEASVNQR